MKPEELYDFPKKPGIYYFRNTIDNKYYIGQAQEIRKRLTKHYRDFENGYFKDMHLYRAWRKYGIEIFEAGIVEIVDMPEGEERNKKLDELEIKYIQQYNSYGTTGYNQTLGGDGGIKGYKFNELQLERQRINTLKSSLDGRNRIYFFDTLTKQYGEALSYKIILDCLNLSKETRFREWQICYCGRYILSRTRDGIEQKKNAFYSRCYRYTSNEVDNKTKDLQKLIDARTSAYYKEINDFFEKYGKAKYNRKDNKTKKEALRKEQKADLEAGITKKEYKEKYNVSDSTFFNHVRELCPEWYSRDDRIVKLTEKGVYYYKPTDNLTEEMKKDLLDGMQVSTFQNKYNVSDSTYYRYKFKTEKEFGVKIKVKTYKKHSEIVTEEQEQDILDEMGTIEYMKKYNVCENTFTKHKKYVANKHPEHQFKNEHTYKPKVDIDLIKDDILNGICKRDFCLKYNLSESCYKKYRRLLLKNSVL